MGKLSLLAHEEEITSISNGQTVTLITLPTQPISVSRAIPSLQSWSVTTKNTSFAAIRSLSGHKSQPSPFFILSTFIPILTVKIILYILFITLMVSLYFLLPHYCFKPLIGPKIKDKRVLLMKAKNPE